MGFKDKYTSKSLKIKDPIGEAKKIEISDDSFAQCELLELLCNTLRVR